jgi:hypothetical protein
VIATTNSDKVDTHDKSKVLILQRIDGKWVADPEYHDADDDYGQVLACVGGDDAEEEGDPVIIINDDGNAEEWFFVPETPTRDSGFLHRHDGLYSHVHTYNTDTYMRRQEYGGYSGVFQSDNYNGAGYRAIDNGSGANATMIDTVNLRLWLNGLYTRMFHYGAAVHVELPRYAINTAASRAWPSTELSHSHWSSRLTSSMPYGYHTASMRTDRVPAIYIDIHFYARVSDYSVLEFKSLQDKIIMSPGETASVFFRLYNPLMQDVTGMSLYYIYPTEPAIYVQKIQCFRFDMIRLKAGETIELPVSIHLDKTLMLYNNMLDNKIYIWYIFFQV